VRVTEWLCHRLQDRLNSLPFSHGLKSVVRHKLGPRGTPSVSEPLPPGRMLSTIQFYNQTAIWATEVGNVATDGMLSLG
jgi:hypothetical protein